jgi:Zn-dependent peptidase ImmA (M78 family)
MSRRVYYNEMRDLAHVTRAKYDISTESLTLPAIARIYKTEGIQLDRRKIKGNRVRAAYFCDADGCSVLVNQNMPREPRMFALIHELKHHLVDRTAIKDRRLQCGDYNAHELIEKGAEVFAAEFIYPEAEMRSLLQVVDIKAPATAEDLCRFKRECKAAVSFRFLTKRFEWFELCAPGAFAKVHFKQLYETLYPPIYKQQWFKDQRSRKKAVGASNGGLTTR